MRELRAISAQVWIENRVRFAAALSALCALVTFTVLRSPVTLAALRASRPGVEFSFAQVMWFQLFHAYAEVFWTISVVTLAMSGLPRDSQLGAAHFTLSLPVRRRNLVLGRVPMTLGLCAALAFLPYILIPLLARIEGATFPLSLVLRSSFCLASGGIFIYGLGILLAYTVPDEANYYAISIAALILLYFISKFPQLKAWDIFGIMAATSSLNSATFLITGPLPWLGLSLSAGAGLLAIILVAHRSSYRDF